MLGGYRRGYAGGYIKPWRGEGIDTEGRGFFLL